MAQLAHPSNSDVNGALKLSELREQEDRMAGVSYAANIGSLALIGLSFIVAAPVAMPAVLGGIALGITGMAAGWKQHSLRREREDIAHEAHAGQYSARDAAQALYDALPEQHRRDGKTWANVSERKESEKQVER